MVSSQTTSDENSEEGSAGARLHDLLPFTLGDGVFAVFTEEVDATAEAKAFARLPRAPQSVVGVVCIRGRMLTVIDPSALLNGEARQWDQPLPCVIALQTDQQLALAAETYRDTITISDLDIERNAETTKPTTGLVLGNVTYASEKIAILDTSRLFAHAIQRRDRRRRRF